MSISAQISKPKQSNMAYIVLRTALNRFQKTPAELAAEELELVNQLAVQEYEIEAKVLSSPEARDVYILDSVIDQSVHEIEQRYSEKDEFLSDLNKNNMDLACLRASVTRELKVQAVMDRIASRSASISDLDIQIYYYLHIEKFNRPEVRTARHILVTINPDYPENTKERAFARLEAIMTRTKRKPKRFAEQAMKHSECPTAMQGGLLGKVPKGQLYPELDAVLFTMKAGEISDIVESPIGFHLLYCEAVDQAGPVSFAEAKSKIKTKLEERRRRRCQRMWLNKLLSGD